MEVENIRVVVRLKPLSAEELESGVEDITQVEGQIISLKPGGSFCNLLFDFEIRKSFLASNSSCHLFWLYSKEPATEDNINQFADAYGPKTPKSNKTGPPRTPKSTKRALFK